MAGDSAAGKPLAPGLFALIKRTTQCLELGQGTFFTACNLLHACAPNESVFRDDETDSTVRRAVASVFLAAKLEERPRRMRDVVNTVHFLYEEKAIKEYDEYRRWKHALALDEQLLLRGIGFSLVLPRPYRALLVIAVRCQLPRLELQLASDVMNDAHRYPLFRSFTDTEVACACIAVGSKLIREYSNAREEQMSNGARWKERVDHDRLEACAEFIRHALDLCGPSPARRHDLEAPTWGPPGADDVTGP